jgi:AraC-like DNA-binding protein
MYISYVDVDHNMQSILQYGTNEFPVQSFMDIFSDLLNNKLNWHWHTELEFVIILQGTVRYYIGEHCLALHAGEGVFINTGTLHSAEPDIGCDDAIMFAVVFSPEFIMNQKSRIYKKCVLPFIENNGIPGIGLYRNIPWQKQILNALDSIRELEENPVSGYELKYHNLLCQAWFEMITNIDESLSPREKESSPDIRRAKLMMEYINTHYSEDISIADIAGAANISKSECFRCFRKVIGKKPFEYLTEYRMEQAMKLLSSTDKGISEIASYCGYNHHSYFGKKFKQIIGCTPNAYRKSFIHFPSAGSSAGKN